MTVSPVEKQPSLSDLQSDIRQHYDSLSPLYALFWGEHLHHGYWTVDESPHEAQTHLVAELAKRAALRFGSHVLDVGCGLGGSAAWLAMQLGCNVLGVTLSPVQARLATKRIQRRGLATLVRFLTADANRLDLPAETFDAVWVIECSEHMVDKAGFLEKCFALLKPGGALALCAWLDKSVEEDGRGLIAEICRRMLCPSLGGFDHYQRWIRESGFRRATAADVSFRVKKTWDICCDLLKRKEVQTALRLADAQTRRFAGGFPLMKEAFAREIMGYGIFAAWKPTR